MLDDVQICIPRDIAKEISAHETRAVCNTRGGKPFTGILRVVRLVEDRGRQMRISKQERGGGRGDQGLY